MSAWSLRIKDEIRDEYEARKERDMDKPIETTEEIEETKPERPKLTSLGIPESPSGFTTGIGMLE